MFPDKRVLLVLLMAVWGCCRATLDLQTYEDRIRTQLATGSDGPQTNWQQYQAAVGLLQAETNKSHLTELLQTSSQVQSTGAQLNCAVKKSQTVPTSVHRLQPGDVKVVAAIGDSLTAGNGAKAITVIGLLTNFRGVAWSIGGEKNLDKYTTLPNIIKKFNPDVTGFATGSGGPDSHNAKLDQAVAGAVSGDMPGQARKLVNLMKSCEHIDFENDWKVVTIMIGGNNLCDYCDDKERNSPSKYEQDLQEALDILHQEMPRTFVNLVTVMDVVEISKLQRSFTCDVLHFFLCRCVSFATEEDLAELQAANMRYMSLTHRLIDSGRYDDRDDFTVVVQPFLEETKLPKKESGEYDRSYFAPDCFHFSLKAHEAAGKALWNNMLEPVGSKRTDWHPGEPLECPTEERPYFGTAKNSQPSLGSANQVAGVGTFSLLKQVTSQDVSKASPSLTALVVVGCLFLVCAAVGAAIFVLRRRRKLHKAQEREPLLHHSTDMASALVVS